MYATQWRHSLSVTDVFRESGSTTASDERPFVDGTPRVLRRGELGGVGKICEPRRSLYGGIQNKD